jgi:HPt (histidine-containing phosphotransfer) domain-containing protein
MDDETRPRGILAAQVAALGPAFRQRLLRDRTLVLEQAAAIAAAGAAPPALRELEIAAHKLHGTAAMFGYEALGETAGRLEAAVGEVRAAGLDGAAAACRLEAPCRALVDGIDAAVAGLPAGGP